jgi:hypothetical protein
MSIYALSSVLGSNDVSPKTNWSTLLIHPIVLETIYLFIVVDWHEFGIRSSSFQSWLLIALHVGCLMQCDMQGLSGCVHLWWSIGCLSWCECNNKLLMVESNYECASWCCSNVWMIWWGNWHDVEKKTIINNQRGLCLRNGFIVLKISDAKCHFHLHYFM